MSTPNTTIRLCKFKHTSYDGTVVYDPDFLTVSGHPEYTLETGNNGFGSSWALYKDGKFVRSFPDLKAARKHLYKMFKGE